MWLRCATAVDDDQEVAVEATARLLSDAKRLFQAKTRRALDLGRLVGLEDDD